MKTLKNLSNVIIAGVILAGISFIHESWFATYDIHTAVKMSFFLLSMVFLLFHLCFSKGAYAMAVEQHINARRWIILEGLKEKVEMPVAELSDKFEGFINSLNKQSGIQKFMRIFLFIGMIVFLIFPAWWLFQKFGLFRAGFEIFIWGNVILWSLVIIQSMWRHINIDSHLEELKRRVSKFATELLQPQLSKLTTRLQEDLQEGNGLLNEAIRGIDKELDGITDDKKRKVLQEARKSLQEVTQSFAEISSFGAKLQAQTG